MDVNEQAEVLNSVDDAVEAATERLTRRSLAGSDTGSHVQVRINGAMQVRSVKIDEDWLNGSSAATVATAVQEAIEDALHRAKLAAADTLAQAAAA